VAVDETALNRIWVLPAGSGEAHVATVPEDFCENWYERLHHIMKAVFGEGISHMLNHTAHTSALFPDGMVVLADDDAMLTTQGDANNVAGWLCKLLEVENLSTSFRGTLIIAGPRGAGLTTDQLAALSSLAANYPREPFRLTAHLSSFI
jgi:hypothetical protein